MTKLIPIKRDCCVKIGDAEHMVVELPPRSTTHSRRGKIPARPPAASPRDDRVRRDGRSRTPRRCAARPPCSSSISETMARGRPRSESCARSAATFCAGGREADSAKGKRASADGREGLKLIKVLARVQQQFRPESWSEQPPA